MGTIEQEQEEYKQEQDEMNKELHELLGECWHEEVAAETMGRYKCAKCDNPFYYDDELNYLTDEGYGKLRDVYDGWSVDKQFDFEWFIVCKGDMSLAACVSSTIKAFHKNNLAPLMLAYLKEST